MAVPGSISAVVGRLERHDVHWPASASDAASSDVTHVHGGGAVTNSGDSQRERSGKGSADGSSASGGADAHAEGRGGDVHAQGGGGGAEVDAEGGGGEGGERVESSPLVLSEQRGGGVAERGQQVEELGAGSEGGGWVEGGAEEGPAGGAEERGGGGVREKIAAFEEGGGAKAGEQPERRH
eukprot:2316081-Rhodomonas_salina.8